MKRILALLLAVCLLAGCSAKEEAAVEQPALTQETAPVATVPVETYPLVQEETPEIPYESRFDTVTEIALSDDGISVDGAGETDDVYTSHDII